MSKDVRTTVKEAYTEALRKSQEGGGGCCSSISSACCTPSLPSMSYGDEAERYSQAAQSSFGCGNPLAFAGVQTGQTVVDLGSGAGFDLLIAAEKVGKEGRVIGIDMTDAMIETANKNVNRAGHNNVEIRKGVIEQLPIDSGSVDWVISNCVINLSPDKPKVFSEIFRVLKPGGRFSISDIVVEELPDWFHQSAAAYSACIGGAISEASYLAGLRDAGLTEVEVLERFVYGPEQLLQIAKADFSASHADADAFSAAIGQINGKVWSAKIVGRRKEES